LRERDTPSPSSAADAKCAALPVINLKYRLP
jgi:hypothetical protein